MKLKKVCSVVLLSFIGAMSLFAHGKGDIDEKSVENLNSWQEEFDLESKTKNSAVKYNIMITATDLGGNQYVEGPFNIYIDPDSDIPHPGITNPVEGMRVNADLNIVGTCVDDDGVAEIQLILDGDEEHPVIAEGKEFWSYRLSTAELEEGDHTIEVRAVDINGTPGPKNFKKNPVKVTWQLDRRLPVTSINELKDKSTYAENPSMGLLVSGNVNLKGEVTDGNGIQQLLYSVDNGQHFNLVNISKNKTTTNFNFSIDTRKFEDGPSVIWFKALDNAGSVGLYSFLYFIDNTEPDVAIVYPSATDVVNGKFSVAGYAKDTIGITELSWSFGDQSGDIPLIPGNPYWVVDVDTIGAVKEKARKFTIHAKDKAGNIVEKSMNIQLNQEDDKPVVVIDEPAEGQIFNGDSELLFVRGIATDDDRVTSVKIQLDSNEPVVQETNGTFYLPLVMAEELSAGNHKITVTGIDENGVEGNPTVVQINSKGPVPSFDNPVVAGGKDAADFINGVEINPEAGKSFEVTVNSQLGLKQVVTEVYLETGKEPVYTNTSVLKNLGSYKVAVPFTADSPKGLLTVKVTATDAIDRVNEYKAHLYVKNTSLIKSDEVQVVFEDSMIKEDGSVTINPEFPLTGYVLGGNVATVELVPATDFATIQHKGNYIIINPTKAIGASDPVVVKVTTDKGTIKESRALIFKNDNVLPVLTIDNYSDSQAVPSFNVSTSIDDETGLETIDVSNKPVTISGKVTCETGVGNVYYKVIGVETPVDAKGLISKVSKKIEKPEAVPVSVAEDGTFTVNLDFEGYENGLYLVEVIAESAGGNPVAKAVAVNRIPPIPVPAKGRKPAPKAKVITFLDSFDGYVVVTSQKEDDVTFKTFPRSEMNEGANVREFEKSKATFNKAPTLSAYFAKVGDENYNSGMNVVLPYGVQKVPAKTLTVYIDTGAAISGVNWEITGAEVAGGDQRQTGSLKVPKPMEGTQRTAVEIPLNNLPSRINKINVTIKAGTLEETITGYVAVVRENDTTIIDDREAIYPISDIATLFDDVTGRYVLKDGSKYYWYGNFSAPITAELISKSQGLVLNKTDKYIELSAEQDGIYDDVQIRITDNLGYTHDSEKINILADSKAPVLVIQTPVLNQWLGDNISITGTIQDDLGVRVAEYSLDKGETWKPLELKGDKENKAVTFSDITALSGEDGLITLDIRARDNAGHESIERVSVYKDTTPPEVRVIEPLAEDVVNGETTIAFLVNDKGWFNKAEYLRNEVRAEIGLRPLVVTNVGTTEKPIEADMSFIFTDDAGNAKTIGAWEFLIDNASDLPRAEIHVPEENQVLTPQSSDYFTISGVIYDDDGESDIYYKIDDGEYIKTKDEMDTSFSVKVPFSNILDNEHTVTVYAVDKNGVKGEEVVRNFRVSLEEPKGSVVSPTIDISVHEVVTITGVASDKNGIQKVAISLDNGNTYNDAEGQEDWKYEVDTRAIQAGTSAVFLKVTDNYGISGLYSSLINIDNQAPTIILDMPKDESISTGELTFSGYAYDNVEISKMYATIRGMDSVGKEVVKELIISDIISQTVDISDLSDGLYNVEVTGEDMAGNKTNVSRNINLEKSRPSAIVDVLYPLNGEHKRGKFNIYGQAETNPNLSIESLALIIDGVSVKTTTMSDSGFYKFTLNPPKEVPTDMVDETGKPIYKTEADILDGTHTYYIEATLSNGQKVPSRKQTVTYTAAGPWISIDTIGTREFTYGDFAMKRPFLKGSAGYVHDPDEVAYCKTKEASKTDKDFLAAKAVAKVEISFDNGKNFTELSKKGNWEYRIENEDMAEGRHFMILRATMLNGETAIERTIVQVDNTAPTIQLISPDNGGRYNQTLIASGLSKDDVGLDSVKVTLRKGDKASYEVPSFIQGLYIDTHFLGATLFDIGAGLTFFDDNVKLQFQWGQYTQSQRDMMSALFKQPQSEMRYGGDNVMGVKLLANIANMPFSFFLGRDWAWLSANFAIGAQFTRFNETNSGKAQILSAILAQVEFPRIEISEWKMFSAYSFYTEFSAWFIPSDVSGDNIDNFVPQLAVGLRVNVF